MPAALRPKRGVVALDEPHQSPAVVDAAEQQSPSAGQQFGHQRVLIDGHGACAVDGPEGGGLTPDSGQVPRPHTAAEVIVEEPAHIPVIALRMTPG
jgi:hypothetical protein